MRTAPAAAVLAAAACVALLSSVAAAQSADVIARGKYLANAGGCTSCHTAADGKPFAGGLALQTPYGPMYGPNITSDKETGIGSWTDDDFYRAMHDGISKNGQYIYPAMPFPWYTQATREDVLAIKAYLFSLPPVRHASTPNKLRFPYNMRPALAAWRQVFFTAGTFKSDPKQTALVNRGDYLVNGLAHCGACHNSRLLAGTSGKFQKQLQGGMVDNWYAPNITSDVRDGIGAWSDAELVRYLKTGAALDKGIAVGPMAEAVHSLSQLTDEDLSAIAAYLKSTPPVANAEHRGTGGDPRGQAGANVYLDQCASCHGVNGEGLAGVVPPLANNGVVLAKGPQNILQVILGGLEASQTYAPMIAIGAAMDNGAIADVANYVRQHFGNDAPATATAKMVDELRPKIDSPMTAGRMQGCPTIRQPAVARALADRKRGIAEQLAVTNEANMPQQVEQIVAKVKASAPRVPKADFVNSLTAAYCRVVREDPKLDWNQRALQLGHFSQLVYIELSEPATPLAVR